MIILILSKLYGIILENKISIWLECQGKRVKGQVIFRSYHSTLYHLITLRIIAEECHNNKTNILCFLFEYRKYFDIVLRTNFWNRLEELKVPSMLRDVVVRLYENGISKFRRTNGWSEKKHMQYRSQERLSKIPYLFGI
jgi:hypothetical protein